MKRILMTLATLGLFAMTSMAADLVSVKARVPFDFTVAGVQFAAGTYHVERYNSTSMLAIKDATGRIKATVQANPLYKIKRTQHPALVFNKYGDRYFLSRVWGGSPNVGNELRKTRTERELMAAAPVEQVIVAAIYR